MLNEKLSAHEIHMARNAERERYAREGITPATGYTRPKATKEELTEAARLNAARALPDAMFDSNPQVQRLRDDLAVKQALIAQRIPVKNWLAAQMGQMDLAAKVAEGGIPQALIEDAVAQDEGFTKTRAAIEALNFAKTVREYARAAYDVVAPSNPAAQHALYGSLEAARVALDECLFSLKKAHVDALERANKEVAAMNGGEQ